MNPTDSKATLDTSAELNADVVYDSGTPFDAGTQSEDNVPFPTDSASTATSAPVDANAKSALALHLHDLGAVQFGSFTLKDGSVSPVYLDLRLLVSHPPTLAEAARAYAAVMTGLTFDRIVGIPYAALPIATAVALETGCPLIYPRREVKAYGTGKAIEGKFVAGETALVLDDVISSGASKLEAIQPLEAAGLVVRDVLVLVDRQGSGPADLAAAGYRLHSVFTLQEVTDCLAAAGRISAAEEAAVADFLRGQGQAGQN